MNKCTVYYCDYCGEKFDCEADCLEHEESHVTYYYYMSDKELSNVLEDLSNRACELHTFGRIAGMPLHSFENLMEEAAKRIKGLE